MFVVIGVVLCCVVVGCCCWIVFGCVVLFCDVRVWRVVLCSFAVVVWCVCVGVLLSWVVFCVVCGVVFVVIVWYGVCVVVLCVCCVV